VLGDPINSDDDVQFEILSGEEKGQFNVIIDRWMDKEIIAEHRGSCWSWPTIRRDSMKYLLFAIMMSVPDKLGYHRHNTEAIYYIDSGRDMLLLEVRRSRLDQETQFTFLMGYRISVEFFSMTSR